LAVAFLREQHAQHRPSPLAEGAEDRRRSLRVPTTWDAPLEDVAVLRDGTPPGRPFPLAGQHHRRPLPLVARLRAPPSQPIGLRLPTRPMPWADGCVGYGATAFAPEFLPSTLAQGAPRGKPDPV